MPGLGLKINEEEIILVKYIIFNLFFIIIYNISLKYLILLILKKKI